MSVEAVIGVVTALVALLSAAATAPCWVPLCTRDSSRTTELLRGKRETLRLLIKDLKPKKNGVLAKQVSDLIADAEALLDQLGSSMIQTLEQRIEQKCMCGFLPHFCVQKQACSLMDEKLIPELDDLIQNAQLVISMASPCRGYRQSREVAISGRKRSETKEKIWEAVSLPNRPKLICIHGTLGVGKTAMAKCIHNRALNAENEELFRYVVWVDVEYGADAYRVQESIAKTLDISLGGERNASLEDALLKLDNFLLVLDSMWKPMSLKDIGVPELTGKRKVIVTSRNSTLCDQMGEITVKFEMQPLARGEEAWELFQKQMQPLATEEEASELIQEEMQSLAREEMVGNRPLLEGEIKRALMAELDGLPLAIIKFALALGNTHGEEIDSSNVQDKFGKKPFYIQGKDQELVNHFNCSYLDLDEKLRPCLMYCALFPKGHVINAKELIEYWMWEGLLGDRFDTLEEGAMAGEMVLQDLQSKHLLQWASSDHEKVKMLSLFRSMAIETMSKEESIVCIRSGGHHTSLPTSGRDWNSKVERASFMKNKLKVLDLKDNMNCSQLLTLLLQDNPLDFNHLHKDDFFSSMCNLRVLDMSRTKITTLPPLFRLKKLSALVLHGCSNLKTLPNLSRLQQLIVLDVSHSPLENCPLGLKNLKRLRRLNLSQTRLSSFPDKIVGHLAELEELLMITESNCLWGSTEDNQGNACVEDLFKLKKLVLVQLHLLNTRALNKYVTYAEGYTHIPPKFCFLVGDVLGVRGEENNLSISGIEFIDRISSSSELNIAILRSLRELNVLDVSNLSGLRHLFTVEILKPLTKLRELHVTSCGEMVELVQGATVALCLPKLTRLLLFDLPSLKSLCCGQILHCPELRFIEVYECQNLKFPMINSDHTAWGSSPCLKVHVKGERSWWFGSLEWDNNGVPVSEYGVSPRLHSNLTFTEASAPPELTHRRAARLDRLNSQQEEANVMPQTNNTSFKRLIAFGFIGWARTNLIGTNAAENVIRNPTVQDTAQSNANPPEMEASSRIEGQRAEEQGNGSYRWRILRNLI